MGWFPEEGHDGGEMRSKGEEGFECFVAENGAKGIFDVCRNEDMVWSGGCQRSEVVDHFVCA